MASLPLLLDSQRDVAASILAHLSLKDLAALGACCRATRAAVSQQPEELWQAAAAAELPGHPVLQASCVLAYLRRQHGLHAAIAAGSHTVTSHNHVYRGVGRHDMANRGLASPDFTAWAFVVTEPAVGRAAIEVRDWSSDSLLHEWQLDDLPAEPEPANRWCWDPHSTAIAGCFYWRGGKWPGGRATVPGEDHCGVLVLHVLDGSCTVLSFTRHFDSALHLCIVGWSSRSELLIEDPSARKGMRFAIYTAQGALVASMACQHSLSAVQDSQSPCGRWVALQTMSGNLHLWGVHADCHVHVELLSRRHSSGSRWLSWSPASDSLLLSSSRDHCILYTLVGHTRLLALTTGVDRVLWGPGPVAGIVHFTRHGQDIESLHMRAAPASTDSALALARIIKPGPHRVWSRWLSLSHDGAHCAVLVDSAGACLQVAVMHLCSGIVQTYDLPASPIRSRDWVAGLVWSASDDALLVSMDCGVCNVLIRLG